MELLGSDTSSSAIVCMNELSMFLSQILVHSQSKSQPLTIIGRAQPFLLIVL